MITALAGPRRTGRAVLALIAIAVGDAVAVDDTSAEVHLWPLLENTQLPDGKHRVWALCLYHRTTEPDGSTYSWHVFNYLRSREFSAVLPLWYQVGPPERRHSMLVPLWFQGPGYVAAPLLLTGRWKNDSGGKTLWATPLFHLDTKADGSFEDLHALTFFKGEGYQVLFPTYYETRVPGDGTHRAVVPLWFSGPRYWAVPPALTVHWHRDRGGSSTWITPLAHVDRDRTGAVADMHVLNCIHTRDDDVFFPLLWATGRPENRHYAAVPLWFQGERWWCAPPALSFSGQRSDGGRSTWITPLAHLDRGPEGAIDHAHLLTYVHTRDDDVFFPLLWATGRPGNRHYAAVPLWFQGERWWCAPPALSYSAQRSDGGRSTWIAPLAHLDRGPDGAIDHAHLLTYVHTRDDDVFFPLLWATGRPGNRHYAAVPLWFQGERWWCAPPVLSYSGQRSDGGRSTWITPLAHLDRGADGAIDHAHMLAYVHTRTSDVLFPLLWATGRPENRHYAAVPAWFQGEQWWCAPPALSARWRCDDGGHATWITPLYHRRTAADGTLRHQHLLTWYSRPGFQTAFPLFWRWRTDEGGQRTLVLPLSYRNTRSDGDSTTTVAPALFSYHRGKHLNTSVGYQLVPFVVQNAADGREVNVLWRLFHRRETARATELMIAPLWWSERHRGAPARWQILGGLVSRNCNYESGKYRYYALWLIPLGGHGHFTPTEAPATGPAM